MAGYDNMAKGWTEAVGRDMAGYDNLWKHRPALSAVSVGRDMVGYDNCEEAH